MRKNVSRFGLFLVAAFVAGCGGGGGSSVRTAAAKVVVDWPDRTRAISGPSSALSAHFRLIRTDLVGGPEVTFDGNRDSTLTAHPETFTAGTAVPVAGQYTLLVTFYTGVDETGNQIATASASIRVKSDGTVTNPNGTALGAIEFNGSIENVDLVANQSVRVGGTQTLLATARGFGPGIFAISPGSFKFELGAGETAATLAPSGDATGISVGSVHAKVTVDNVVGLGTFAVVPAAAQVTSINLDTNDLAYSAVTGKVYAAVFSPSPQVVPIDPTTAATGTPIVCASTPVRLTVSTNGLHLYAGEADGTIERFLLPNGTLEGSTQLPAGTVPAQMLSVPNYQDTWIVATQDGSGAAQATFVYTALTPASSTAPMGNSIAISPDGTKLYGSQFSPNRYSTATVSYTGFTDVTSATADVTGRIHYANGTIVGDDGTIADPATGTATSHLTFTTIDHVLGVVPNSNRVYYAAWDSKQVQTYDLPTATAIDSFPLGSVSGGMETATWCGPKRLAIRTFSGSPNEVLIVSGLP